MSGAGVRVTQTETSDDIPTEPTTDIEIVHQGHKLWYPRFDAYVAWIQARYEENDFFLDATLNMSPVEEASRHNFVVQLKGVAVCSCEFGAACYSGNMRGAHMKDGYGPYSPDRWWDG